LNRFIIQVLINHPLTVYGNGGQTRGFLNIKDTLACIRIAIENPAQIGELRIMNQFTEQFSVNELAELVSQAGKRRGLNGEIIRVENPRIEKENHYYNANNSKLLNLGLQPTLLTDDSLDEMLDYAAVHADNINTVSIANRTKWTK